MPEKHGHDTKGEDGTDPVLRLDGDPKPPQNQNKIESHDDERPDHTPFFSQSGKDEIGLLFRQKTQPALSPLHKAFSNNSARSHSDLRLNDVIASTQRIQFWVKEG